MNKKQRERKKKNEMNKQGSKDSERGQMYDEEKDGWVGG